MSYARIRGRRIDEALVRRPTLGGIGQTIVQVEDDVLSAVLPVPGLVLLPDDREGVEDVGHLIATDAVAAFLVGAGPLNSAWHIRYRALKGFFRIAVSRGHLNEAPLPTVIPKPPPPFVPYIYSRDDKRIPARIQTEEVVVWRRSGA